VKRKLTPEERKEFKRLDEFSEAARANMQRILDEVDARRREREQRASRSIWNRLLGRSRAA
jgi:DNA replication initiation complex subunit (GINS family)